MGENDYDDLRKKNIAERNALFAELFQDLKRQTDQVKDLQLNQIDIGNLENEPPKKKRKTIADPVFERTRAKRVRHQIQRKYNTRSKTKNQNNDSLDHFQNEHEKDGDYLAESKGNRRKLYVLFPWAKPFQREIDLMKMGVCDVDEQEQHSDDDLIQNMMYKVKKAPYDPNNIPSIDDITEDMLNNVAQKSVLKQYSKINGTSCHQCRQKTLDTKTVCRSGECIGLRGQFCGPCLRGRYGESAIEALKDPAWACPPCRGLCNCSICRTKNGLCPTGILAPQAQEDGYSSVMEYLQSIELDDSYGNATIL